MLMNGTELHWVPSGVIADGEYLGLVRGRCGTESLVVQRQDVELIACRGHTLDDYLALRAV